MLQVFYKNTDTVAQTVRSSVVSLIADHVIEYTKSGVSRALFTKGTCVRVESPRRSDSGGRGKKDKTMGDYIKKFLNLALTLGSRNV